MKFLKIVSIILAISLSVTASFLLIKNFDTKNPPIIKLNDDYGSNTTPTIETTCDVTDSELLKYVSATDTEDGDITQKIVVERKKFFLSKGKTLVSFAVSDSDDNVASLECHLIYTDYESPKIEILDGLVFPIGSTDNLISHFKVTDKIDNSETITPNLKLTSSNFNSLVAGTYSVNCKVTNSFGDSKTMDVNVIVTDIDISAVKIKLKNYFITIKKGEEYDFEENIKEVSNKEDTYYSNSSVEIDHESVDVDTEGLYDVLYTISDSNGEGVAIARAFVNVVGEDE